jgi:hypothetical protein
VGDGLAKELDLCIHDLCIHDLQEELRFPLGEERKLGLAGGLGDQLSIFKGHDKRKGERVAKLSLGRPLKGVSPAPVG